MAGLTREQRAARAAAKAEEAEDPQQRPEKVVMTKDGAEALVNNNASVAIMEAQGWKVKQ